MAKRKSGDMRMDDFFASQLEHRVNESGRSDQYLGRDSDKIVIGLPLNAISLRYLFVNNVFPYSRMTELVGRSESCKTAFLFEMYRWHIFNTTDYCQYDPSELHGGYIHNLVEPRDSPDLRESILRCSVNNKYPVIPCDAVEDWQKSCTDWVKRAEENYEPGGMAYPIAIGVDSVTAATTRDEMNKTWEQGYADPGFSQIAKSINLWNKVFFQKMRVWPVSFIGINHMKESKDPRGYIDRRIPGGDSLKYIATFLFRFQRKDDIEHLDESGRIIEITTDKNSLSPAGGRRKLTVRMTWQFDDNGKQATIWDWHDASVELLTSFDATRKRRIMDIVTIENVDKKFRTADCSTLGLKKVSWTELGEAIMKEPEIVSGLDKLFGVRKRKEFELGVPYAEQISNAIAEESEAEGVNEFDNATSDD